MNIYEATTKDIGRMARHHAKMFEEISEKNSRIIEAKRLKKIEKAYAKKLEEQMPVGACKAWVMKEDSRIVASGAMTICSFVPGPADLNDQVAYLHSIYTDKNFRGRRCANTIVEEMIKHCKENRINRMVLNASEAAKPIYENLGFVSSPDTMRLFIK
ncbi:MAG: GNAT family N-acetyltransferase [Desulfobacteraceae bacterium]|nr:GNAT family N-acetyltransferase [Desulfobacteraceae bacterium]